MVTAHDAFDNFRKYALGEEHGEFWAPDVVIETPFAAGGPRRHEGRDNFLAATKTSRESLPVRFEEMRNVVVHDTTDPNKIIVEYELVGTLLTTGKRESALFIAVLEVRDGLITLWREYQNTLAIARALGQIPHADTDFAASRS
ncbi:nuclear transport factor 2 family protein [Actinophytocola sp.]|uniref:nuclear transport factor 2 family protein n=1 Tax=Actinophytocola sp. TaxID=1872138 RepID=UPI00389AC3E7